MQGATQEVSDPSPLLRLKLQPEDLPRLATLLQAGFYITAVEGDSVSSVLQRLPGFTPEYIERDVQTIFLNGTAIDDLSVPLTGSSAVIALSAAMPGLAGAILRKNSPHASLRQPFIGGRRTTTGSPLAVQIKLFNQLAVERGPELCRAGVSVKASELTSFFRLRPALVQELQHISLDGAPVTVAELLDRLSSKDLVTMRAA
ncbi:hypothetical protein [Desulfofustis limnaeus]|uniref:Uncharacterized protein n=1 Tax=Desulfofustis limnaeus TaxID=2740163 RepID=A0ABM7W931_9BACT|nr:hypothetical protein [Desulfofustis limnaeus]BDD87434.1 hypothetical protein DPPLL_17990 [Desulfofustis limnaeus]